MRRRSAAEASQRADPLPVPRREGVPGLSQDARRDGGQDRRGDRRHARPHPRRGGHGRDQARQARLLREAAGPFRRRGPRSDEGRPGAQGRDPAGQPGPLVRHDPHVLRVDLGRGHRQRAHDPLRLPLRQLRPGHAAAAGREGGRPGRPRLGPLARSRPGASVPFLLPARPVAELGPLRQRHHRRLGLPRRRSGRSGLSIWARPRPSRPRSRTTIRRPRATPSREATSSPSSSRPRAAAGPITLIWHSGTEPIPRPKELEPGRKGPQLRDRAATSTATRASIMYGSHGAERRADHPRRRR